MLNRCTGKVIALTVALLVTPSAMADDIVIMGLFKNKVVLKSNGRQQVVKVGETTNGGSELVSANSKKAVFKSNGKTAEYGISSQVSLNIAEPKDAIAQLSRGPNGMYRSSGRINNTPVNFLVDTGATFIAMNSNVAKSAGIDYKKRGKGTMVSTASGPALAFEINLDKVSVGEITLRNINAMVLEGDSPREVLLGMSFLNRLDMRDDANVLTLRHRY